MRIIHLAAAFCLLASAPAGLLADNETSAGYADSTGNAIIDRYVQATQADNLANKKNGPLEVEIEASVPKLKQEGHLTALRKISVVGKITYRVLRFQGDSTVKNQVIARYLQAEQQGQDDKSLTLSPANYKFKLKGEKATAGSANTVYIFQVSPRTKRIGLFKGEVWVDAKTYLAVVEKGRLVKNPSVFFRNVSFERDFAILNGASVPSHMTSIIDTRLVGKVNLSVAYTSPVGVDSEDELVDEAAVNPE